MRIFYGILATFFTLGALFIWGGLLLGMDDTNTSVATTVFMGVVSTLMAIGLWSTFWIPLKDLEGDFS